MSSEEEPNPPEKPGYTTRVVTPLKKAIAVTLISVILVCVVLLWFVWVGIWLNPVILQSDLFPIERSDLYYLVPFTALVTPIVLWMFKVELNRPTTED